MSKENIKQQIKNHFAGEWYCETLKLYLKITERTRGLQYWFEYNHPPFPDNSIIEEPVDVRYIDDESPLAHLSSQTWRLPMLRFSDKNTFQLIKAHPITKEISELAFIRKVQRIH